MKKIILSFFIVGIITLIGCSKGDVGPVGATGTAGVAGQNGTNGTTGATGTKGTTGATGTTGTTGTTGATGGTGTAGTPGATGDAGQSNVITTDWTTLKWRFMNADGTLNRYYQSELAVPQITKEVLDKGLFTIYVRLKGSTTFYELNQGVAYSVGGKRIDYLGAKEGAIIFQHKGFNNAGDDPVIISTLNGYEIESRVYIIIGNKKG